MISRPKSIFIPVSLIDADLSATCKLALSHYAYWTATQGHCTDKVCRGDQYSLPEMLGVSDEAICLANKKLVESGWITIKRTIRNGKLSYLDIKATDKAMKHFTDSNGKRLRNSPERFVEVLTECVRNTKPADAISLSILVRLTKEVGATAEFRATSKALVARRLGMAASSLSDQFKRLAGLIKWDSLTNTMSLTAACIRAVLSSNNKDSRAAEIMSVISNMFDFVESGSMCEIAFIKHCRERIKVLVTIGAMADAREVEVMIEALA
jgi:hypothetical protein